MTLDDEVRGIKDMMVAMINLAAKELANNRKPNGYGNRSCSQNAVK